MRKRSAIYIAAGMGLALLWYLVAYRPLDASLGAVREKTSAAEAQLADYNETVKRLPEYLKANETLETLRAKLNSSLFAKSDILDLFRQLSRDAADHRLELVQISPPVEELLELNRQAIAKSEPQFLNVTLDFKGRYMDFGRYIGHLEARPYFQAINNCYIRGNQILQPTVDMAVSFKALLGTLEESG